MIRTAESLSKIQKGADMRRALYWFMGVVVGFTAFGLNVAARWVVDKTDQAMDYVSSHSDHDNESFHIR